MANQRWKGRGGSLDSLTAFAAFASLVSGYIGRTRRIFLRRWPSGQPEESLRFRRLWPVPRELRPAHNGERIIRAGDRKISSARFVPLTAVFAVATSVLCFGRLLLFLTTSITTSSPSSAARAVKTLESPWSRFMEPQSSGDANPVETSIRQSGAWLHGTRTRTLAQAA
jgi:hypothetical protein